MSGTSSSTKTFSYTKEDVTKVVRRFSADLLMIASSTKGMTEDDAAKYGHDVEYLAQRGFLKLVDVTLLDNGTEVTASQYLVRAGTNELIPSKPGGVLWPTVGSPQVRIVLRYTDTYSQTEKDAAKPNLKFGWSPTNVNLTHPSLTASDARDYSSNGYGISRKDFK
jgi:hypothetical protein